MNFVYVFCFVCIIASSLVSAECPTDIPQQDCGTRQLIELNRLSATPVLTAENCAEWRDIVRSYYTETFDAYEQLFSSLVDEKAWTYRAEPLRHPLIFYYGHTAAFYINKFVTAGLLDVRKRINPTIESLVAVGVDEMSWDQLLDDSFAWPNATIIREYRQLVRQFVLNYIESVDVPDALSTTSPWWILLMGVEHERIHLETSAVILRRMPLEFVQAPTRERFLSLCPTATYWSTGMQEIAPFTTNAVPPTRDSQVYTTTQVAAQDITVGRGNFTKNNILYANNEFYGWDNEFGTHTVPVQAFAARNTLVTNAEYYQFWSTGGYKIQKYWSTEGWQWATTASTIKRPLFWSNDATELRTLFTMIPIPWDYPVEVNAYEASAFAEWATEQLQTSASATISPNLRWRLPTEHEYIALRRQALPDSQFRAENANTGFVFGTPRAVTAETADENIISDVAGNVWQWAESVTYPFDGFETHPVYDDFTVPTYDGRHAMILGGSFASCGNEETIYSRYAFRRHFYQFAGLRLILAETVSTTVQQDIQGRLLHDIDAATATLMEFNYGKAITRNFPQQCAEIAVSLYRQLNSNTDPVTVADIGCGAGRASFEFANICPNAQVLGTDVSTTSLRIAHRLQQSGSLAYTVPREGEIPEYRTVQAADLGFTKDVANRVKFVQIVDQYSLRDMKDNVETFDIILAANLIERLSDPALFIRNTLQRVSQNGILVITSSYAWDAKFTDKTKWLGARSIDAEYVTSERALTELITKEGWERVAVQDIPMYIRETERTGQYKVAQLTAWRKSA